MAKLKLLKLPKVPKLPKKPKQSASVEVKKNWLRRVQDAKAKHEAKKRAVMAENKKRTSLNKESDRLSSVISGISGVKVFNSGFSTRVVRKKPATKKAAPKKKPAVGKARKKAVPKRKTARRR